MSDEIVFLTERTRVRRWCQSDLPSLLAVYGDADAMRWVGDGTPITREAAERWLTVTQSNYEDRGYGMYAVELREQAGVIGFCGLIHPGGQVEAELKYAYLRAYWGRGLATEVARGALDHAAEVLGLTRVIATTAPEHKVSHRVLLNAGMRRGDLRLEDDGEWNQLFEWTSYET